MKTLQVLFLPLLLLSFEPAAWTQNLFIQGDALSDRIYNSDTGPTNSQLTLDFTNAQSGVLQNILTWGENSGAGGLNGTGQSFEAFVLRPTGGNSYQVVFATGYLTVANVGTNTFAVSGTPFGLQVGDVVAHYGRGIPFSIGTGGPSSVYIAANLPPPVVGTTVTVPGATYPLYNDGGRNYAIQVQALGQPFLVTTNSDNGPGSLRQAAMNANAFAGASTINFATNLSGQTITLTNGQIELSSNVVIDATALGGLTISGNHNSRILQVDGPAVVLRGLTFTAGNAVGVVDTGFGGAVLNLGTLSVDQCTFTGNQANNHSGFGGGGMFNYGTLTVADSTFTGNESTNSVGGGGINNYGTLTANNCTFFNNNANSSEGGGGIDDFGTLTANHCTIVGNQADSGFTGGGIFVYGTLYLTNSIVCSNSPPGDGADIYRDLVFGTVHVDTHNLVGVNPLLAPFGNYGGPTPTMLPLPGSPAIDAGAATILTTDQRGLPRVVGTAPDLGAVESGNPIPSFTPVVTTSSDAINPIGTGGVSLREAVAFATNNSTITFAAGLSGQTITLTSGQIVLNTNVTIDASALTQGVAINGNHTSRIFNVSGGHVVLNSLTITNGTDAGSGGGGGILNSATLKLNNCTLAGNVAGDPVGGGGGIYNHSGTLTLNNSTVAGNSSDNTAGGGGGIDNNGGTAVVNQSTLAGNSAANSGGGGGIDNGGTLLLTNSIVAANSAAGAAGADIINYSTLTFGGANLLQAVLYNGFFGDTNGTYNIGAPQLAPLGNYGGPTPTMPPLPGSPAIDAGAATTLTTDQRGYPRAIGPATDIGAVEFQASPVVTTADVIAGSLRYAITYVTNNATITFDPGLSGSTITLTSGQITIANHLTIDGSALANGIRIQNPGDRLFQINSSATVVMNSLTLMNGNCSSAGGAILNEGGNLTLNRSTLSGNLAQADGGGGAIFNDASSILTLNQCTLTANHAHQQGGAIYNYTPATLTLVNCTISSNTADEFFSSRGGSGGGGIFNSGTLLLINDIVAGNSDSVAANISSAFTGANNLTGGNPQLASLGNYGGPTLTMPPLPGSPAIDAGAATTFTMDQRGYPRPVGLAADIGAVEGVYAAAGPGKIKTIALPGNGSVQLSFTNVTDAVFPVLAATNLSQSVSNWVQIGFAFESPVGSGQFPFTDTQATNYPQRFYLIRSP